MTTITPLVRWDDTDAEAVAAQLLERVRAQRRDGLRCGIVACLVLTTEKGNVYEVGVSHMPAEVAAWAATVIQNKIQRELEKP